MDKLKMQSMDKVQENIRKIQALFPNAVTECADERGGVKRGIDFDVLKQELADTLIDERELRYQFTWPDKQKSVLLANTTTNKTLRPCKEESVDFDSTQNLYIEGDNLEVLKLLQETYLGKIKMIYIDPPYNTGNDFVYNDDFSQEADEYKENSGQLDEQGNRLFQNTESNGRFHTDWLNMIYPRLRLAKDLLSDDGVIFISIDDNEVENLKKICSEIFGQENILGIVTWSKKRKGSFLSKKIVSLTEYCLVVAKDFNNAFLYGGKAEESESQPIIKRTNPLGTLKFQANSVITKLNDGIYSAGIYGEEVNPVTLLNDVIVKNGLITNDFSLEAHFVWSQAYLLSEIKKGGKVVINTKNFQPRVFRIYDENSFKGFSSFVNGVAINGTNEDAYEELEEIFNVKKLFDYSKPVSYIKEFIKAATYFNKNSFILDFFSGSATTAHAVMQLNAEDGGNRKFIMVQLPEPCDEKSEAYKAGYKNICEIGKERIRRAGTKIKRENGLTAQDLDTGFRVLKLDSSNMKDVYYRPEEYSQSMLEGLADNIKPDRTAFDLLFQVMLDLGKPLSAKIEEREIAGKIVFNVDDGDLIACFESNITSEIVTEIAKAKPLYAVFRDSGLSSDSVAANFEQIFATYSPSTVRKVL
ncbi:MAG: site-specific DNA-methyltransferase [Treponemataceae bacterium]|nr:site-specific DNA-methyltransferase [Treponemataceae bacterium]